MISVCDENDHIVLQKQDRKLIKSIFVWQENMFSVQLTDYEDVIWCKSKSEIYIALEQFKQYGFVNTDEDGMLVM